MKPTAFGTFSFVQSGVKAYDFADKSKQAKSALLDVALADGAYDPFGTGQSPKPAGAISVKVKFTATSSSTLDAMLDSFKSAAFSGQQWLTACHNSGSTLQAYAKLTALSVPRSAQQPGMVEAQADFEMAEPYWYAASQTSASYLASASSVDCSMTNGGDAPIKKLQISVCGACVCPMFTNVTNGMSVKYGGTLGASDVLLLDTGAMQVLFNGVDSYGSLTLGNACQIAWMQFESGSNTITFTASNPNSASILYTYRTTWH